MLQNKSEYTRMQTILGIVVITMVIVMSKIVIANTESVVMELLEIETYNGEVMNDNNDDEVLKDATNPHWLLISKRWWFEIRSQSQQK